MNFINENFSLLLNRDDEEFMFFSKSAVTTTEPEKWPLSIGDTTLLSHIGNINFSSDSTFRQKMQILGISITDILMWGASPVILVQ